MSEQPDIVVTAPGRPGSHTLVHDERLAGVHPKLVEVVRKAASICPVQIMVVQGCRSQDDAFANFGKGRTPAQCVQGGCPASFALPHDAKVTWVGHALSSKHVVQADGFGHAVDLSPVPYEPKITPAYTTIANAMKQAAHDCGVGIVWGGDWATTKDFPHFQLGA